MDRTGGWWRIRTPGDGYRGWSRGWGLIGTSAMRAEGLGAPCVGASRGHARRGAQRGRRRGAEPAVLARPRDPRPPQRSAEARRASGWPKRLGFCRERRARPAATDVDVETPAEPDGGALPVGWEDVVRPRLLGVHPARARRARGSRSRATPMISSDPADGFGPERCRARGPRLLLRAAPISGRARGPLPRRRLLRPLPGVGEGGLDPAPEPVVRGRLISPAPRLRTPQGGRPTAFEAVPAGGMNP